jgi:TP901-1 family phage major tail protein|tara:strand:- start:3046 stop:3486 length:441 start_codon:yes stop_codon:yes gene_type:complete
MAKQLGRGLLLALGTEVDGDPNGDDTYTTIAGLNSKSLTMNNSAIDVTTPVAGSEGGVLWAESLSGLKQMAISGDGIFAGTTSLDAMNTLVLSATPIKNIKITVPGFGAYYGAYHIDSFEMGGETEGAVTFSISMSSTTLVTFTAD